jgi:cysteine desulfurase
MLCSFKVVPIYFDHNATTPLHPAVLEAMTRVLSEDFGNASSVHVFGQQAKAHLDAARARLGALIGAEPHDLVWTAGGTEADNFAVRGIAEALEPRGRSHLVASGIEHEAVLNTCRHLQRRGWQVSFVPPTGHGLIEPSAVEAAMTPQTALVSVMHANNEIGTIQPVADIARVAHAHGALMHTDAVQTVGKIAVDVRALDVDLLSLSAHKFGGPKGAGALWVRRGTRIAPILTGGRHERNRRAGTENVPAIVGLGVAAEYARREMAAHERDVGALRDRLEAGVLRAVPGTVVNGDARHRVWNTTNISFERVEAESLLIALDLDGIAVSTGSACSSGTLEPSHVLKAMRLPPARTQGALRFSLGPTNTDADVNRVLDVLPGLVDKLRSLTRMPAAR